MNDLTRPPEMTAWHGLTPGLWTALTNAAATTAETVEELRQDPQAVTMVREAIPALQDRCRPCGDKAVIATLSPMLTLYGVSDRSAAEWKIFWTFYLELLAGLPLESVQAGVRAYVSAPDSNFFPKPGPLLALCQAAVIPSIMALGRARRMIG